MKETIHKRCLFLLDRYLRVLESGLEVSQEDAELALAIHKVTSPKILKLGDIANGFPCSRKRYEKMLTLLKQRGDKDCQILVWDDLIDIIDMNGESILPEQC